MHFQRFCQGVRKCFSIKSIHGRKSCMKFNVLKDGQQIACFSGVSGNYHMGKANERHYPPVFKNYQQVRHRTSLPPNFGIVFVPQQEAWIIERFGKFYKTLEPGLSFLIPVVDSIRYVQSLKELAIDIPQQSAITADNVTLNIDGVLYLRILDPYKASYGVEDAEYAITQLAQTTMRSEIGKIALDTVFKERENLNTNIVFAINKAAESWGIDAKRYEIRDMKLPSRVQEAMQMQVEAERKKRAAILESEGIRAANINVAEGQKRATILTSEAYMAEAVNRAQGEAEAVLRQANARAEAIKVVATALGEKDGKGAVSISVAEKYIDAFGKLAKEGNTILLPSNTGDVTNMVAQAMAIYKNINLEASSDKPPVVSQENTEPERSLEVSSPQVSKVSSPQVSSPQVSSPQVSSPQVQQNTEHGDKDLEKS